MLAFAAALVLTCAAPQDPPILVRAGRVLPIDGPPIDGGAVLVRDGEIAAVGRDLAAPAGARVLDYPDHFLVPGFVELHCHVGMSGGDINDSVLPHNMDLRTLDLALLDSPELERARRAGVTTVLMIPGSGSSIGGLGTLAKTGGGTFAERLIRFPGALKIALHARGGNPSRGAGDLGLGRLGLHYMLRRVMADARAYHAAWAAFEAGETSRKPAFNPRLEPLRGLFRREFPVILHAYGDNDTMVAIRILKEDLGIPIVISHGVYDSFLIKERLAESTVAMNLGPRQYEFYRGRFVGLAAELHGAGVPVSVRTDAPVIAQDQLQLQAAMAARLGLPAEAALRALTIEPARAIGIADRVGSLAPGKDADLVLFPGDPVDPRHRPDLVMIDGRIVLSRPQGTIGAADAAMRR